MWTICAGKRMSLYVPCIHCIRWWTDDAEFLHPWMNPQTTPPKKDRHIQWTSKEKKFSLFSFFFGKTCNENLFVYNMTWPAHKELVHALIFSTPYWIWHNVYWSLKFFFYSPLLLYFHSMHKCVRIGLMSGAQFFMRELTAMPQQNSSISSVCKIMQRFRWCAPSGDVEKKTYVQMLKHKFSSDFIGFEWSCCPTIFFFEGLFFGGNLYLRNWFVCWVVLKNFNFFFSFNQELYIFQGNCCFSNLIKNI